MTAKDILVIGYGNELRGDDGAGPKVAMLIAAQNRPGVRVLIQQQLTPELAESIAKVRAVIFIDAVIGSVDQDAMVTPLVAAVEDSLPTHIGDPKHLLALTKAIYGSAPPAWWITVPGTCFDFGERFSPLTERAMKSALLQIDAVIKTLAKTCRC